MFPTLFLYLKCQHRRPHIVSCNTQRAGTGRRTRRGVSPRQCTCPSFACVVHGVEMRRVCRGLPCAGTSNRCPSPCPCPSIGLDSTRRYAQPRSYQAMMDKGLGMVQCMNRVPITHVCFGNHEGDVGLAEMRKRIQEFQGPRPSVPTPPCTSPSPTSSSHLCPP